MGNVVRKQQTSDLSGPGTGVSGGQFAAHTGSVGDVDADLEPTPTNTMPGIDDPRVWRMVPHPETRNLAVQMLEAPTTRHAHRVLRRMRVTDQQPLLEDGAAAWERVAQHPDRQVRDLLAVAGTTHRALDEHHPDRAHDPDPTYRALQQHMDHAMAGTLLRDRIDHDTYRALTAGWNQTMGAPSLWGRTTDGVPIRTPDADNPVVWESDCDTCRGAHCMECAPDDLRAAANVAHESSYDWAVTSGVDTGVAERFASSMATEVLGRGGVDMYNLPAMFHEWEDTQP